MPQTPALRPANPLPQPNHRPSARLQSPLHVAYTILTTYLHSLLAYILTYVLLSITLVFLLATVDEFALFIVMRFGPRLLPRDESAYRDKLRHWRHVANVTNAWSLARISLRNSGLCDGLWEGEDDWDRWALYGRLGGVRGVLAGGVMALWWFHQFKDRRWR